MPFSANSNMNKCAALLASSVSSALVKDEDKKDSDEVVQASPKRNIRARCGRSTIPQNPAITPNITRALVKLADLTEYNKLGGEPGWDLSLMIECADAFFLEHEARLRDLVDARCAQLRLWLDTPATMTRKLRNLRKEAKDCLRDIADL